MVHTINIPQSNAAEDTLIKVGQNYCKHGKSIDIKKYTQEGRIYMSVEFYGGFTSTDIWNIAQEVQRVQFYENTRTI